MIVRNDPASALDAWNTPPQKVREKLDLVGRDQDDVARVPCRFLVRAHRRDRFGTPRPRSNSRQRSSILPESTRFDVPGEARRRLESLENRGKLQGPPSHGSASRDSENRALKKPRRSDQHTHRSINCPNWLARSPSADGAFLIEAVACRVIERLREWIVSAMIGSEVKTDAR